MKLKWSKAKDGNRVAILSGGSKNKKNRIVLIRDEDWVTIKIVIYYREVILVLKDDFNNPSRKLSYAYLRAQAIADAFDGKQGVTV